MKTIFSSASAWMVSAFLLMQMLLAAAPAQTPIATTQSATNVYATNAKLIGTVNPNGSATTVKFQLGPTTAYGMEVVVSPLTNPTQLKGVSAKFAGLAPSTTYHYRV